jgi:glycogen operon protein
MKIWKGYPYPLGATWMGTGTNFALFAPNATRIELCLYDDPHTAYETGRVEVEEKTDEVWHVFLPDVRPRTLYGYR